MANISKDGTRAAEEVDNLSNSELFSFMSFSSSDFITIAGVIKAREESANASIAELKDKNGSLEKELLALKGDLADREKDCMALREREKLNQEKIKGLMEEVRKESEESANRRAQDDVNYIALKQKYSEIEEMEIDIFLDFHSRMRFSKLKRKLTSLKSEY